MPEPAVLAEALSKQFGDVVAVDAIDLNIPAASVMALLGPNGAGKTTIVRMLATLCEPTSGTASVCGFDIVREADAVRNAISLTGQFAALEANLTAQENLILMARLRGYRRRAAAQVAEHLIDQLDIAEFKDKLVKSISGGQRRRVDLAASLVVKPKLLVLDEPTTGLDPRSRQAVWSAIRELVTEGVTVLLTTQYLEEADELADQVVVMDHGRAVASGTPPELRAQIGDHRVDVVVADPADVDRVVEALGSRFLLTLDRARRTVSVPAPNEAVELALVAQELKQAVIPVDEISLRRPTLDDAFLALTGEPSTTVVEARDDFAGVPS